ncbi:hypothetical protein BBK82_05035 [Lentzea guizhouensis]|uniref:Uncharacterized protein n=1 Tax=Lentzea guizhouensis TaxID=1586287 RepID=A0A1B2HCV1_9PSEU|nr:hypothetical protein BBK82_05035 [Lentzea guizhouensis]
MASGSIPIYMRAGTGAEHEIGAVTFDGTGAELDRRFVGQLLRAAADELDPPEPTPERPGERAQQSPRDRQVRTPGRNR